MTRAVYRVADPITRGGLCIVRGGALRAKVGPSTSDLFTPDATLQASERLEPGDSCWIEDRWVRKVKTR